MFLAINAASDMLRNRKPNKKVEKRWCERISCIIEGVCTTGLCISRCLFGKMAVETRRQILNDTWHQSKIREREGPSRGIQKCAPRERSPCAPKFEDRSHEETLFQERFARKAAWDLANILTSSSVLVKSKVCRRLSLRRDQKNENSWSIQEQRCA